MKTVGFYSHFKRLGYLQRLCCACAVLGIVACNPADDLKSSHDSSRSESASSTTNTFKDGNRPNTGAKAARRGRRIKTADGKFVRSEVSDTYNKNKTLLVLAAESDVRAAQLYSFVREWLTPEQITRAESISASYDDRFLSLLRQRARILENATDDGDVDEQMKVIYQKTIDLSQKVRSEIRKQVLTDAQRKAMSDRYKETLKENSDVESGT